METQSYKQFLTDNPWLEIYALFKALKIQAQWQSWESSAQERKNPNPDTFKKLLQEFRHEVDYHIFVQYLCFQQFKEIKEKAHASGILLKGDIPILINRDSADVWFHRSLFLMEYTAGVLQTYILWMAKPGVFLYTIGIKLKKRITHGGYSVLK